MHSALIGPHISAFAILRMNELINQFASGAPNMKKASNAATGLRSILNQAHIDLEQWESL